MQTQPNNQEKPQPRMTLASVQRGKIKQPMRLVMYGPPGIGKSTFASQAPNPIFIGAEKGTAMLDVARFPQPERWEDVHEALRTLWNEKHDFKTLVVDTLDWLEPLNHAQVVAEDGKVKSIDEIGYGRGFNVALDKWRVFLSRLEKLCDARGLNIILLAHCHVKTFKAPDVDHYDRYELKLHAKANGLIQEWADEVLFANYETLTREDDRTKTVRGVSDGTRLLHTVRHACWDAKNRHSLPAVLPLSWDEYAGAVRASQDFEDKQEQSND